MTTKITATFRDERSAEAALSRLLADGASPETITVQPIANITAREARFMTRVVLIIVFWSIIGAVIGVAIGAALALTVGPEGTSGVVIQTVSWGILIHLLVGIWAGYILLADRTEHDVLPPPAELTVRVEDADADAIVQQLRDLGARELHGQESMRAREQPLP